MKRKEITDKINTQILQALEQGVVPWRSPYKPQQSSKGHVYRGINRMMLNLVCHLEGYKSPVWWTFNAANMRGGSVRKGEKSTVIVYYGHQKSKNQKDSEGDPIWFPVFKTFRVFNQDQVEMPEGFEDIPVQPEGEADKVIEEYLLREKIALTHEPRCAWYSVTKDEINVPLRSALRDPSEYMSAMFHEMGHSTGAKSRLNRETLKGMKDVHDYSQEELVAEMCSAYLCGHTDTDLNISQSASYINGWMEKLKEDPTCLHKACDQAEKAYQYVLTGDHDLKKEKDNG